MTNDAHKAIADVPADLGKQYPDMRFGQLVVTISTLAGDAAPRELYDMEDDEFIQYARSHLTKRSQLSPS